MIALADNNKQLLEWAQQNADAARALYISEGSLLSLGYAMAMRDVADSISAQLVAVTPSAVPGNIVAFPIRSAAA